MGIRPFLTACMPRRFLPTPSTLIMDAEYPRRTQRQDNAVSSLNVAIEVVNLAKEVSSVTPAKAVFGSVSILLTMIRVCFLFCSGELRAHMQLGLQGQQSRIQRTRAGLRRCVYSPRPWDERKETRRPQSVRVRCDHPADDVG